MVLGLFGRKQPSAASRLESGSWRCASCEEDHGWPFDLAAFAPDAWPHAERYEANSALHFDGDFLSEDFCVLGGEQFIVRTILPIPVIGLKDRFAFGCWSTLSETNFDKYIDGFDSGEYADMGPWPGWLMNRLAGFNDSPEPLAVHVQPQRERLRPELWVAEEDHPLGAAQRDGIIPERMLEVLAHFGHAPG
ncbi:DUF2199 domain-containing protein [Qipengyuania flava]|uniref:DUF2199 domain-containing protein n=1 Tax=Qipengyuania flava TaxID=192812 RepID=UPI003BAEE11F